jgi:PPOX class probable F420-dependent enzyme
MPGLPLPPEIDAFLAEPNMAVIATARADGAPYSAPTWYDWVDGRILVNMERTRIRLEHMRREPRVAMSVLGASNWYQHVSLTGLVTEIRDDPDLADIDRLSIRYGGEPFRNRERDSVTALIEPRTWFQMGVLQE